MDIKTWKIRVYRFSYRYHLFVRQIGWTLLAIMPIYGLLILWSRLVPAYALRLPPFDLILRAAVLSLPVFIFWFLFSGWYSVRFRYLAWWAARTSGAIWRWLTTGWRAMLMLLIFVIVITWLRSLAIGFPYRFADFLTLSLGLKVIAVTLLLMLFYWVYQTRKRIVIMAFADYTNDKALKASVTGLAPRLLNELAGLTDLHGIRDEARPTKATGRETTTDVTVTVEDVGTILQDAIGSDSKVAVGGFLQIPVGAIVSAVTRVMHGPRLTGSLHKEGDKLILTAIISGGNLHGNWRVGFDDLCDYTPRVGAEAISKMTEQLACRIFTDLARVGSPKWRAVSCYTEGLRIFRDSRRIMKDHKLKLRQAEKAFIQALAEDNRFAQCHYNLGIVYRDLKESASAQEAFQKAVEADPNQAEAYYALAINLNNWQKEGKNYADVIRFCDQAIKLQPGDARAWDLKGFAQRKLVEQRIGRTLDAGERLTDWKKEISPTREIATMLAWRALCRSALKRQQDEDLKAIARTCTRNLAVAYAMLRKYVRSSASFHQAIYLVPTDAELYFELGKTLLDKKNWQRAVAAFEEALCIEERSVFWARLAETYADLFKEAQNDEHRQNAEDACKRALDHAFGADEDTLNYTKMAWEKIGKGWEARRVESISDFRKGLDKTQNQSDDDYIKHLEAELEKHQDWDWAYAQIGIKHARQYMNLARQIQSKDTNQAKRHASDAEKYFLEAIKKLTKEHPREIREQGLYGALAEAFALQNQLDLALYCAEYAVALNPENAWERWHLGELYFRLLNDYERAEIEWEKCLDLEPTSGVLLSIADTYLNRGAISRDSNKRRQAFLRFIETLNHAVKTMESDVLDLNKAATQMEERGSAYYWLGRFHYELMDYDKAILYLKMSQSIRFKPLESSMILGWAYFEAKAYDEAEQTFRKAVAEARKVKLPTKSADAPGEEMHLLFQTHIGWALSYAERSVNLQRALCLTRYANWLLAKTDKSSRQQDEADLHDCIGYIRLKEERVDEAIRELEQAVALAADGGAYFHLAQAYMARAQSDWSARTHWRAKAREACARARDADVRGRYSQEITDFLRQLNESGKT